MTSANDVRNNRRKAAAQAFVDYIDTSIASGVAMPRAGHRILTDLRAAAAGTYTGDMVALTNDANLLADYFDRNSASE